MSINKTFKTVSHKGTINSKAYSLMEYTTYYHPYDSIDDGIRKYAPKKDVDLAVFHLVQGHNSLCASMATDQFGNEWYKSDENIKYVAFCGDKALNTEPTFFWDACQSISRYAGLPKKADSDYYEYCYKYLQETSKNSRKFEGEYVPDYEGMFKVKFKVGDRVFYVRHYGSETRNGDRYQVHSMIVRAIIHFGPDIYYLDYDPQQRSGNCSDRHIKQSNCEASVEDLCKKYKNTTLYMWHSGGGCRIEPCSSTSQYLSANPND